MTWLFLLTMSAGMVWMGRGYHRQDDVLALALNSTAILAGIWGWSIAPMSIKSLVAIALLVWGQWHLSRWSPLKNTEFRVSNGGR
jgi:hypothetical protein